jgi:hypothetical protein
MGSYRSYESIIKQAELTAMSPDAVVTFLKQRATQSKDEWRYDVVDDDIEAALLARGGLVGQPGVGQARPLHRDIVALVRLRRTVGRHPTLRPVQHRRGRRDLLEIPSALFDDEAKASAWLTDAPSEELTALFENHNLDDSFLRDLLEAKKPWDQIPDDRLATIVARLHRNERMRRPYDYTYMDGYAEYSYGAVFNAAWTLAERMEPTVRWAAVLNYLYDRMETKAFSIETPLELAARWRTDPSGAEAIAKESKDVERGWLSNYQGVRKGLARLALRKDSKLLPSLLASDDPALRSAAYSDGAITPEQLSAAHKRDGELVFNQAIDNHKIWRSQAGRDALKAVAWAVVHADKHSDLLAANIFNGFRSDLAKKHPDWFKNEDDFRP